MASVRAMTASRRPRALQRSSENQYGRTMVHALANVRRSDASGPTGGGYGPEGTRCARMADVGDISSRPRSLSTRYHRRQCPGYGLHAAAAAATTSLGQTVAVDSTGATERWEGFRLKPPTARIHSEVPRDDSTGGPRSARTLARTGA